MKGNLFRINLGGLFRCCVQALTEDEEERKVGDVFTCPHCNGLVELKDHHQGPFWAWKKS